MSDFIIPDDDILEEDFYDADTSDELDGEDEDETDYDPDEWN